MATVAIIGGGITGLSCAYYLRYLGGWKIKYLFLVDKSPKFGGWIQTTKFPDGAIFEHGPRTLRVGTRAGYNALALADQLGLSSRILSINKLHPTAKTNYILANRDLHPLPQSTYALFRKSTLFKKRLIHYVVKEALCGSSTYEDESVYSFVERRAGEEIAKYIVDPMCRGIAAGDARELSVRSLFPFLYEAELKHGSVIKAVAAEDRTKAASGFSTSNAVKKAYKDMWKMWTLKGGVSELTDALACTIDDREKCDLVFNAKCSSLTFKENKAEIMVENEKIKVDHIFSCIPSYELSPLMASYPKFADNLMSIPAVDVAVVYLEYVNNVIKKPGFGFLAPSSEDSKVLGITFDSCCFPELNGISETRLSCMLGGRWFNDIFGSSETVSEETILQTAIQEVGKHLGVTDMPVRHKVIVQKKCIPQYIVGHHKTLERLDEEIKANNFCLSLLGASYKGVGVPDCIFNARLAVEKYLESLS